MTYQSSREGSIHSTGGRDGNVRGARSLAASVLLALAIGASGCGLFNKNYVCRPAPGPDEPVVEEPDRFPGSAADSVEANPCRPGPRGDG